MLELALIHFIIRGLSKCIHIHVSFMITSRAFNLLICRWIKMTRTSLIITRQKISLLKICTRFCCTVKYLIRCCLVTHIYLAVFVHHLMRVYPFPDQRFGIGPIEMHLIILSSKYKNRIFHENNFGSVVGKWVTILFGVVPPHGVRCLVQHCFT